MINLRYHVVSLVAVFLALGVGVVMGSTVIDRVTVDELNRRVNSVEASVKSTRDDNRKLSSQLGFMRDFADQARDQISRGRLKGVPVLVVGITGIDRKPVDGLDQALISADASMVGRAWFTTKMRLDNEADARALAAVLGMEEGPPDVVRQKALAAVAAALNGKGNADVLPGLVTAGFLVFENPPAQAPTTTPGLTSLPSGGVRVVLVSGAGADVGDDLVAVPLAQELGQSGGRMVAAEGGQDTPGGRAVFVGLLRKDDAVAARVSTVDDLESSMGQAATVLALADLSLPRVGHFGVGPGAQRLLPATQS